MTVSSHGKLSPFAKVLKEKTLISGFQTLKGIMVIGFQAYNNSEDFQI